MKKQLLILLFMSVLFFNQSHSTKLNNTQLSPKSPVYRVTSQKNISIWRKFAKYQRKGNKILNRNIRSLKNKFDLKILIWLLLFSFGYGILHAVGPGHGKALVGFYFLRKKAKPSDAGKLAFIIALTHTGSALLLAVLFHTILSHVRAMGKIQIQSYFNSASGILIILLGLWFLYSNIKKGDKPKINESTNLNKNIYAVGIFAGIIPCPVALTVILITIPSRLFLVGLVTIIAMAIGLSIVLFIIGLLTIKSRQGIINWSTDNPKLVTTLLNVFSYTGAIGIILLGLFITFIYFPFGNF